MNKSWWNLTISTQLISDDLLRQINMYCSLIDTTRTDRYGQKFTVHRKKSSIHIVNKSCTTTCCITIDRGIRPRHSKCPFFLQSHEHSDFTHKQSQKQLSEYHNNIHIGIQHCCIYVIPLHNLKQITSSLFFGCQLHHSFNQWGDSFFHGFLQVCVTQGRPIGKINEFHISTLAIVFIF